MSLALAAQPADFPVKQWNAATQDKPLVFYITGDGGLNSFSNSVCAGLNKNGYEVIALNAKKYFWDKKTPEQTATDVAQYLANKLNGRKNQEVILIGYSFGADVIPFVVNRLPAALSQKVATTFIMASSGSTDFEIHVADMFGKAKRRGVEVVPEINKMGNHRVVILNGSEDEDLDLSKITLRHYTHEVLPGGHHFEGKVNEIVSIIVAQIER